jgi:hypothetical protein
LRDEQPAARRMPSARRQRLEMLLGILGFFTVVSFVVAAYAELTGKSGLQEVIVLVVFLVATWFAYTAWRRS